MCPPRAKGNIPEPVGTGTGLSTLLRPSAKAKLLATLVRALAVGGSAFDVAAWHIQVQTRFGEMLHFWLEAAQPARVLRALDTVLKL